jgi:hypothetical protein
MTHRSLIVVTVAALAEARSRGWRSASDEVPRGGGQASRGRTRKDAYLAVPMPADEPGEVETRGPELIG